KVIPPILFRKPQFLTDLAKLRTSIGIARNADEPVPLPPVSPTFLYFRDRTSLRNRLNVCSRSRLLAATSSVRASQASASSFSSASRPFSLRKTRQVASAVRLLPSTKGCIRQG